MRLTVAPEIAGIVRPHVFEVTGLSVREAESRLDEPLRLAAEGLRARGADQAVADAIRAMYRRTGVDPTKTRPSSEALLRRVRKGDALPRVNSLVDVINWCSAESGLPFGLYDRDRIEGDIEARLGRPDEEYAGIRKDVVHLSGRLTLADARGPFGNPTSDSARTMTTPATKAALVVIFVPVGIEQAIIGRLEDRVRDRLRHFC
jgi:DNA/RNA-binding domain of Phe-tRNA-synthetase-like protein